MVGLKGISRIRRDDPGCRAVRAVELAQPGHIGEVLKEFGELDLV